MRFPIARFAWLALALPASWLVVGTGLWLLRGPSSREALVVGAAACLLLAPAIWWISGRISSATTPRIPFVLIHGLLALVFGNVMVIVTYGAEAWVSGVSLRDAARGAPFLGAEFLFWMGLYALLGAGAYGSRMHRALRDEREATARAEARATEARLATLRGQLNPHFLFNALHGVIALIRRDADRAEVALERLGDLLRFSLDEGRGARIRLGEEIRFTRDYLDLEKLGLGERLTIRIDVEESTRDAEIPPFAIQTLVENAVRHGIAPRPEPGFVHVRARDSGAGVSITVENSGPRIPAASGGVGRGLINLRDRLEALYGSAARLDTEPVHDGGFVALLVVPR